MRRAALLHTLTGLSLAALGALSALGALFALGALVAPGAVGSLTTGGPRVHAQGEPPVPAQTDNELSTQWEWARVGASLHDEGNFGHLQFADR